MLPLRFLRCCYYYDYSYAADIDEAVTLLLLLSPC